MNVSPVEDLDRSAADNAKVVRNTFALSIGQMVTWVPAGLLAVMLPRYLGDEGLGRLSFALSVTGIFSILIKLGTDTYLTREVARNVGSVVPLTITCLAIRLPLVTAGALIIVAGMSVTGFDVLSRQVVYIALASMVFESFAGAMVAAFIGIQEMGPIARALAVSKITQALAIIALLLHGDGVLAVAAAWSIGSAGVLVILALYFMRWFRLTFRPKRSVALAMLRGGLPFLIWQASLMIYGQADIIMLSFITNAAVAGWYSAPYRIINFILFWPAMVSGATFPALSATAKVNPQRFNALTNHSIRLILVSTIPMSIGMMMISGRLIDFLGYPSEFTKSIPIIVLLAAPLPVISIDMIIGNALIAHNKQSGWAIIGVGATVVNLTLNFFLIHLTDRAFENGAIGAATATLITEIYVMIAGLALLRQAIVKRDTVMFGLKCLVVGLGMAAVVWVTSSVFLVVSVGLGAVFYAGALFGLRIVTMEEVRSILRMLLRRNRDTAELGTVQGMGRE